MPRLTADDRDIDLSADATDRADYAPGMGIVNASGFEILPVHPDEGSGPSPEIHNIDDDDLLCFCRIDEGKEELGCTGPGIDNRDPGGPDPPVEFFGNSSTESVIGKERVAASGNHNLGKCHAALSPSAILMGRDFSWLYVLYSNCY